MKRFAATPRCGQVPQEPDLAPGRFSAGRTEPAGSAPMTTTAVTYTPERTNIRVAAGVNDAMLAIGRILIALIFVSSGIEKFIELGATASAIGSKGLPYPNVLAVLTAILEAFGGVLIIVGWQTRLVALTLAIFCAAAAFFFHDFWNMPSGQQYTNNMIHFMKNASIIGGFLMLCAVGAGRYSLDGPCIRPEYLRSHRVI
jgi:putative oxidoreductase